MSGMHKSVVAPDNVIVTRFLEQIGRDDLMSHTCGTLKALISLGSRSALMIKESTGAPGREPAGYMEGLKQKEPEIGFDPSRLRTKQDWINAGEVVFDSSPFPRDPGLPLPVALVAGAPATRDGVIPYFRYFRRATFLLAKSSQRTPLAL
jgi:hypothetical protein